MVNVIKDNNAGLLTSFSYEFWIKLEDLSHWEKNWEKFFDLRSKKQFLWIKENFVNPNKFSLIQRNRFIYIKKIFFEFTKISSIQRNCSLGAIITVNCKNVCKIFTQLKFIRCLSSSVAFSKFSGRYLIIWKSYLTWTFTIHGTKNLFYLVIFE